MRTVAEATAVYSSPSLRFLFPHVKPNDANKILSHILLHERDLHPRVVVELLQTLGWSLPLEV